MQYKETLGSLERYLQIDNARNISESAKKIPGKLASRISNAKDFVTNINPKEEYFAGVFMMGTTLLTKAAYQQMGASPETAQYMALLQVFVGYHVIFHSVYRKCLRPRIEASGLFRKS